MELLRSSEAGGLSLPLNNGLGLDLLSSAATPRGQNFGLSLKSGRFRFGHVRHMIHCQTLDSYIENASSSKIIVQ